MTRRWRWSLAIGAAAVAVGIVAVAVVGAGYLAYEQLSPVKRGCENPAFVGQTPADFTAANDDGRLVVDAAPYRFGDFEEVAFPSRGGGPTIRGWFAPPAAEDGPVVIAVHGRGSCRRSPGVLLPAGMLHRTGFGVLVIDLRNHGDSDVDNGRWAGGGKEYRDPLGAWDWLVAQGYRPERIGIFGSSLGAATIMIAMGEEPRLAAAWADSSYADFAQASSEYAIRKGYPGWVATTAIPIGRLIGDPELGWIDPDEAARRLAGRPLFIAQGLADTTVLAHHAVDLAAAAFAGGTSVQPWIVPGAEHTEEIFLVPDEYERRLVEYFTTSVGDPG
jgi:dipeptidyl aminopeptidase/acylaminoacyl peptidase